jgi:hypothetical protein
MIPTPTQKARQLVETFYFSLPNNGSQTGINNVHSRWEEGKTCAMIAARALKEQLIEMSAIKGPAKPNYWDEVKQEIEKL